MMRFAKLDGRLVLYPGTGFYGLENIVTVCEPNGADERKDWVVDEDCVVQARNYYVIIPDFYNFV